MEVNLLQGQQSPQKEVNTNRRVTQTDVIKGAIKQTKLETGLFGVKMILAADLPTTPDTYWVLFSVDDFVLHIWTGSMWKSTTLA